MIAVPYKEENLERKDQDDKRTPRELATLYGPSKRKGKTVNSTVIQD